MIKKKLIKILVIFNIIIFNSFIFGCNKKEITIEFITNENSYIITTKKDSKLSIDMISKECDIIIEGLYYDKDYKNKYNDEIIKKNTKIYVKELLYLEHLDIQDLTLEDEIMIKNAYANNINENRVDLLKAEDVNILRYYGKINDKHLVVIKGDSELIPNLEQNYFVSVEGEYYSFEYLPEVISVYYQNKYYSLNEACNLGFFTKNNIMELQKRAVMYKIEGDKYLLSDLINTDEITVLSLIKNFDSFSTTTKKVDAIDNIMNLINVSYKNEDYFSEKNIDIYGLINVSTKERYRFESICDFSNYISIEIYDSGYIYLHIKKEGIDKEYFSIEKIDFEYLKELCKLSNFVGD